MVDPRIKLYQEAAEAMTRGDFQVDIPLHPEDEISKLGAVLKELGLALELKFKQINTIAEITEKINAGLTLEDILNLVYETFHSIIPYQRLSLSLLDEMGTSYTLRWYRSEYPNTKIPIGFKASLSRSSLKSVLANRRPRINNDMESYFHDHPDSQLARSVYEEGMRSNLACPLYAMNKPLGFLFFSSTEINTYHNIHIEFFQQIAGQLAMTIEKSRLYEELIQLNNLKTKFLGMAAHDIRNPISSMMSYLDLLKSGFMGPVSPKQMDIYQRMEIISQNMLNLLNDLLDVSALETGKIKIHWGQVDIHRIIKDSLDIQVPLASMKQIRIETHLPDSLPVIYGDPDRIQQVIDNLLSNAIKYSNRDTVISLDIKLNEDDIIVSVKDEGLGIPADDHDALFSEFGRTRVMPTGGETSTGLGLSIARRMIEAHNGKIWLHETEVGKGSTFCFSLPLNQKHLEDQYEI